MSDRELLRVAALIGAALYQIGLRGHTQIRMFDTFDKEGKLYLAGTADQFFRWLSTPAEESPQ